MDFSMIWIVKSTNSSFVTQESIPENSSNHKCNKIFCFNYVLTSSLCFVLLLLLDIFIIYCCRNIKHIQPGYILSIGRTNNSVNHNHKTSHISSSKIIHKWKNILLRKVIKPLMSAPPKGITQTGLPEGSYPAKPPG